MLPRVSLRTAIVCAIACSLPLSFQANAAGKGKRTAKRQHGSCENHDRLKRGCQNQHNRNQRLQSDRPHWHARAVRLP